MLYLPDWVQSAVMRVTVAMVVIIIGAAVAALVVRRASFKRSCLYLLGFSIFGISNIGFLLIGATQYVEKVNPKAALMWRCTDGHAACEQEWVDLHKGPMRQSGH